MSEGQFWKYDEDDLFIVWSESFGFRLHCVDDEYGPPRPASSALGYLTNWDRLEREVSGMHGLAEYVAMRAGYRADAYGVVCSSFEDAAKLRAAIKSAWDGGAGRLLRDHEYDLDLSNAALRGALDGVLFAQIAPSTPVPATGSTSSATLVR